MSPRISLLLSLVTIAASSALRAADPAPAASDLPAFPGAEGFGANTPGGRGGKVLFVTNLDDSGPGSLREACDADGPRLVVFRVSGTIQLKRPLTVNKPYLTIAGQTAPGEGICLRDYPFGIATHDVIVRYLRSRLGDESKQQEDCIDLLNGAHDCILDHCSATWSVDECLSTSGNDQNCTVQWCLIGESLWHSAHAKGPHSYGSLARANGPISWHHNLWIHNDARNPRLGDNYGRGTTFPTFDVRNNVMYDFGATASGLTQGILKVNYVGNYLRPGSSSVAPKPITVGFPSQLTYFIRDNIFEGNEALNADNTQFFTTGEGQEKPEVKIADAPFAAPPVKTVSAPEALELVLANVGATLPKRDAVDARLIEHVRTRTGKLIDSQQEVGGWPELKSAPAPTDVDNDGIPDAWEVAHGLDPKDPNDAANLAPSRYTWIEEYLNSLLELSPDRAPAAFTLPGAVQYDFTAKANQLPYRVMVWAPEDARTKAYPVIYILDGNAWFPGAAVEGWHYNNAIMVGIGVSSDAVAEWRRRREMDLDPGKGGVAFAKVLVEEIKPFIESTYQIESGRRTLYGLSLGGLMTTHVMFNHPEAFDAYVICSPALSLNHGAVLQAETAFAQRARAGDFKLRVLVTAAGNEDKALIDGAAALADRLKQLPKTTVSADYAVFADETHGSVSLATTGRALTFALQNWSNRER